MHELKSGPRPTIPINSNTSKWYGQDVYSTKKMWDFLDLPFMIIRGGFLMNDHKCPQVDPLSEDQKRGRWPVDPLCSGRS